MSSRVRWFAAAALAVVVGDQVTKWLVVTRLEPLGFVRVIPGALHLISVRNTGAAFGLFAGHPAAWRTPFFVVLSLVAAVALVHYMRGLPEGARGPTVAAGAILGGALGNLIDRLRLGEVIDFIDVHWGNLHWPAFNVADMAITLGVAVLLAHALWPQRSAGNGVPP